RAGSDIVKIEDVFGKSTQMVLLVPKGDLGKEENLVQELEGLKPVKSVLSYVNTIGAAIPPEYLEESITEPFYSDNYSRIILQTNTEAEGDTAFAFIEEVQTIAEDYYGDEFYTLGEAVTLYDIKNVVQKDNSIVNVLTVVTIAFVLLITFKSITFPLVLLLTIQSAVWINLS